MKKFFVDYLDKGGDYCHVWVEANSKDDAIYQAKREYWDIDQIVDVHQQLDLYMEDHADEDVFYSMHKFVVTDD